jgi:hypothetical protein
MLETLRLLRTQKPEWRLWHPIDPSRPDAALRELSAIGPRNVVWLNEAQFYLDVADGGVGERVAAGFAGPPRSPARNCSDCARPGRAPGPGRDVELGQDTNARQHPQLRIIRVGLARRLVMAPTVRRERAERRRCR